MARDILVCGLWHETNSFSPLATDLEAFHQYVHVAGDALLDRHAGTNTEIGGFMRAAPRLGMRLVPALYAGAVPSGLVTSAAFARLLGDTVRTAARHGPYDGALVALHGALCAQGEADAEGEYLAQLRSLLGPRAPIVATFDIHANLSPRVFELADVLVGYDTYPHVDMGDRGEEAAAILAELLTRGDRLARAHVKLPLLTVPQVQGTETEPVAGLMAALHAAESDALRTGSIALGFPYSDVAHLGVSVVGYGTEARSVRAAVDALAARIWSLRTALAPRLEAAGAAVSRALAAPAGPVVLVDVADNVGGGSPGDGTVLLDHLLRARADSGAVVMWDPAAARAAVERGVGARFEGAVGGRTDHRHGAPVNVAGTVRFAERLVYRRTGSYMTGLPVDLGQSAVIDVGGLSVLLTERRAMPFDADHLRAAGIVPETRKVLVVKSAIAWKAPFAAMAADHAYVDTPGACASNLRGLQYARGGSRCFPLDASARWAPG